MQRHHRQFLVLASIFGPAALGIPAQAYDASCQTHTINQLNSMSAAVCGSSSGGCEAVKSFLQQSKVFLENGSDVNHALSEAYDQASQRIPRDPQVVAQEERLKAEQGNLNIRDPAQVREEQKKIEKFLGISAASRDKQLFADPTVDKKYADDTRFQIKSDLGEGNSIIQSALVPRPPDAKQVKEAVDAAAAHLQLAPSLVEKVTKTEAYRDGLTAFAVANSIASTGNVAEKYRLAMTKFDVGADVAAQVQADHLVAGMAFDRVDGVWGGTPDKAGVRKAMGPEARSSVSAQMSIALEKSNVILQETKLFRDTLKIHEPPSPPKSDAEVESAANSYKAAMKDAVEKIHKVIWGPTIHE